ncbi:MAG: Holliday junction branch migration protein RuvA [Actinomycetaceae bacterium]|nr:Holliday junction branch migration protein RuvA [Actinomycetaceae bacterium]MDU0969452.1 Holliday junction branch migration protein RuvA [Actinomycetaceae bacterium]
MIAMLTGTVRHVGLDRAIIDVGGVGYEVWATPTTLQGLHEGEDASVHTYLAVREDSMTLFAFASADERATYMTLLSVPKIGPKLALAALALFTPDELRAAVESGDEAALTRIPGVGKKSAQRMLIDIGDKLRPASGTVAGTSTVRGAAADDPLIGALENLGWPRAKAAEAMEVQRSAGGDMSDAALLRGALQYLGAHRG